MTLSDHDLFPQAPLSDAIEQLGWQDSARAHAFAKWLESVRLAHDLTPDSVRAASADASFRRYFRVDAAGASLIIMDAPPEKENSQPFVDIAGLMQAAGLLVPKVLAWEPALGFMLLDDLGQHTMMQVLDTEHADANLGFFNRALDALLVWQQASRPDVLPLYDAPLLQRELQLFPDWYVGQYRGKTLDDPQKLQLQQSFDVLVARNLSAPMVFVHRDFMPRNLMVPWDAKEARLGVLDFQDAVYGPITYDIASLMRDAFVSWEEDFCIDVTVRYWERARALGMLDHDGWHSDFGAFYSAVEWMGLQRHLKVAGIFARLSLRDGKPKYLADTPRFLAYIRATCGRYRELKPLLRLVDGIEDHTAVSGYAYGRV
jgi:aminoglycoside/choline kinase family phosphotransferase